MLSRLFPISTSILTFSLSLTVWGQAPTHAQPPLKPRITASVNLGGMTLTEPLRFATERVSKPGTVIAQLALSPDGAVQKSTIIAGDAALRPIVTDAVAKWRFANTARLPTSVQAWIYFVEDTGPSDRPPVPQLPPPPVGAPLGSVDIRGASKSEESDLRRRISANPGDPLTQEVWDRAKQAAHAQKPPMEFQVRLGANGLPYIRIWR